MLRQSAMYTAFAPLTSVDLMVKADISVFVTPSRNKRRYQAVSGARKLKLRADCPVVTSSPVFMFRTSILPVLPEVMV